MRDQLINLIPEINLISDDDLRDNTIFALISAMETGGWAANDLNRLPFTLLIDPCPATMLQHIRGVVKTSLAIAGALRDAHPDSRIMKPNMDYLVAGAILHDIGKFVEYEESNGKFVVSENGKLLRHPISGASIAYAAGLPTEIEHAIAYHSHEGDGKRKTIESIIINHADFLNFEPFKL